MQGTTVIRTMSIAALTLLCGCDDGADSADAPATAAIYGVWRDDVATALIAPGGSTRIVLGTGVDDHATAQIACSLSLDSNGQLLVTGGNQCSLFVHRGTAVGGFVTVGEASGLVAPLGWLRVTLAFIGNSPREVVLPYGAGLQSATGVAALAGNWSYQDAGGYAVNLTIASSGRVTGNDSYGCRFGGMVSTPVSGTNLYHWSLEESICRPVMVEYRGLAAGLDGGLLVALTGFRTSYVWRLTKS